MVVARTEKEEPIKNVRNRADESDIQVGRLSRMNLSLSGLRSRERHHDLEAQHLLCCNHGWSTVVLNLPNAVTL